MVGTSRTLPRGEGGIKTRGEETNREENDGWKVVRKKNFVRKEGGVDLRSSKWDIAGGGGSVKRNEWVSYYFTEIPDDFGAAELLKVFRLYGEATEVVIPAKRDRRGKRFGFARFDRVRDPEVFGIRLDNIIIGSKKVFVNLPRFERARNHQEGVINKSKASHSSFITAGHVLRDSRTFADMVKGTKKEWKPIQVTTNVPLQYEVNKEKLMGIEGAVIGEVRIKGDSYTMEDAMQKEGIFTVKVAPMGANLCLLQGDNPDSFDEVMIKHKMWMEERFRSFSNWEPSRIDEERVTWVRCLGIPVHGWSPEFFDFLTKSFGSLLDMDEDTGSNKCFDVAVLKIATKCREVIDRRIKIFINQLPFDITVVEVVSGIGLSRYHKELDGSGEESSVSDSEKEFLEETLDDFGGGFEQNGAEGCKELAVVETGTASRKSPEVGIATSSLGRVDDMPLPQDQLELNPSLHGQGVCALQKSVGSVITPCLSRSSSISDTVSGKGLVSDKGMVSLDLVKKGFKGDDEKVQGSDVTLLSDQQFVEKSARGRIQSCMRPSQSVLFKKSSRLLVGLIPL